MEYQVPTDNTFAGRILALHFMPALGMNCLNDHVGMRAPHYDTVLHGKLPHFVQILIFVLMTLRKVIRIPHSTRMFWATNFLVPHLVVQKEVVQFIPLTTVRPQIQKSYKGLCSNTLKR